MELEVTWNRAIRVWLSYLWRVILVTIAGTVLSGVFGFILGLVWTIVGLPMLVLQPVAMVAGLAIGLAITVVPIKLILGKDYGEFRLVLVANALPQQAAKDTADVVRVDDPSFYVPPRFASDE
jgi:hypothetical protein